MLAALLLGILMLVLDITGVALAAALSWSTVVTLFAVLSGLLVAMPLVLIACALVAGLLAPSAPVSLAVAPGYSISVAGGAQPPPFLGAPGATGFNLTGPPYSSPYSSPASAPYTPAQPPSGAGRRPSRPTSRGLMRRYPMMSSEQISAGASCPLLEVERACLDRGRSRDRRAELSAPVASGAALTARDP